MFIYNRYYFYFFELVGREHRQKSNRHNNRLCLVLELLCNSHIHKNVRKSLLALFLFYCGRKTDK